MINLTIPLYQYIPTGNIFPWDSPFITEDIATYERNAARLFYISMGSETGTRLMTSGLFNPKGKLIQHIPLEDLLNIETMVFHLPKEAGEVISLPDVRSMLDQAPLSTGAEAVLIATGWGDNQRWKTMGEEYVLKTPHFTFEAAEYLADALLEAGIKVFFTDCYLLDSIGTKEHHKLWLQTPSWIRLPYPSENAKAYLRAHGSDHSDKDWKAAKYFADNVSTVVGLANCGNIKSSKVRINCLPLFIDGVGETPCTVVAEE